ncbi:hypothetical protein GCM10007388_40680 [Pseudoduganella plicata]|nr:hypothetical protein GCM10007388_40680 [Pseudoduganella plicata]
MGKPAALKGDMTFCPQCKGTFAIQPDGKGARHNGKPYAHDGDGTACGAPHRVTVGSILVILARIPTHLRRRILRRIQR